MAGSSNREEKVSGRKALATARTTRRNYAPTADSGHARTKSVATLAHDLAGLVRPLHGSSPVLETGPGAQAATKLVKFLKFHALPRGWVINYVQQPALHDRTETPPGFTEFGAALYGQGPIRVNSADAFDST
jgi:hypothetical protein